MTCKRGHEFRGDENYRARHGWCPVCFRETQRRYEATRKAKDRQRKYDHSVKGRARHLTYDHSDKGGDRSDRYRQSPKGWLNALNLRRTKALKRRKQRQEAEDSHG